MNKTQLNVFIADEDKIMTTALSNDLKQHFGSDINIRIFNDAKNCIENMDDNTHLVIMAYDFKKRQGPSNGIEMLKFIKKTHPLTEVVIHSSNDDLKVILKSIKLGAKGYVVKQSESFSQIRSIIRRRFTEPIRKIITEFGVNKFLVIFFSIFVIMGVVAWLLINKKI
ncbi:MAG TPA: response regulator [Bacteroidia bacterium]|jgi:DNA-binding NarL/FixJ family response regulator